MNKEELHNKAKALREKVGQSIRKAAIGGLVVVTPLVSTSSAFPEKSQTEDKKPLPVNTKNSNSALVDFFEDCLKEKPEQNSLSPMGLPTIDHQTIEALAEEKTQELQAQIIENVGQLQNEVKEAKRTGRRNSVVAGIFSKVSPTRLSGANNYCVAGATCAYENIDDPLMKQILDKIIADNTKTAGELQVRSGHPNLACGAFREFYKKTLGENYADRKSPYFRQTLQNLKPGDIIIVSSTQNTSSGMHCVTFEKYDEHGNIRVKSLNRESDYSVPSSRILAVAQISNQFQKILIEELERNPELAKQLTQENGKFAALQNKNTKTYDLLAMSEVHGFAFSQKQR